MMDDMTNDELAEIGMTEDEFDAMTAEGEPVAVMTWTPPARPLYNAYVVPGGAQSGPARRGTTVHLSSGSHEATPAHA